MPAKVLKCSCQHEYQDKAHGLFQRVCNSISKGVKIAWKCTVCNKVHE